MPVPFSDKKLFKAEGRKFLSDVGTLITPPVRFEFVNKISKKQTLTEVKKKKKKSFISAIFQKC